MLTLTIGHRFTVELSTAHFYAFIPYVGECCLYPSQGSYDVHSWRSLKEAGDTRTGDTGHA